MYFKERIRRSEFWLKVLAIGVVANFGVGLWNTTALTENNADRIAQAEQIRQAGTLRADQVCKSAYNINVTLSDLLSDLSEGGPATLRARFDQARDQLDNFTADCSRVDELPPTK